MKTISARWKGVMRELSYERPKDLGGIKPSKAIISLNK
jgi:hypothetical protein